MSELPAPHTPAPTSEALKEYLRSLESVAVAFSSGVDSTFLLKTARDVLGDKCIAITAMSCSFPKRELEEAKTFCEKEGIRHITVESEELEIEGFCQNPTNRGDSRKKELFEKIWDKHVVDTLPDGTIQLYIDRLYCHEVTSPQAFAGLRARGLKPFRPAQITCMPDHNIPTLNQEKPIEEYSGAGI